MHTPNTTPDSTVETSFHIPSRSFAHALARTPEIEKLMVAHNYHGKFATHSGYDIERFLRGDLKEIIYFHCPAQAVSETFKTDLDQLLAPYTVHILLSRTLDSASSAIAYDDTRIAVAD
ncbi:hypothetical protein C0992_009481 [Termitomyces sp. T32_za158]|nr:hypothetical protein C0992_009481 [Termitomyces sp. T32_za158]